MTFELAAAAAAIVAGGIASVAGFGIGSVLTPLLSLRVGAKVAVAAVSIPHVIGTAVRFWLLRGHVDRRILVWFGITSAAGGLAGALLHAYASSRALAAVFGCLLLFVGFSEMTGFMKHVRLGRRAAWIAGAASGVFGGLVGNQGGIRSAALLAFDVKKEAFVATATAVGLIVDGARMPVYLVVERSGLLRIWPLITISAAGVVSGTLIGARVLRNVPDRLFRRIVAVLLLALGTWMVFTSASCGGNPAPPSTIATVRIVFLGSTTRRSDLPPSAQACVSGVGATHTHPSWRNFSALPLQPVPPDRYEITFNDVPTGTHVSFRVNDQNSCDENPTGAVTRNVFANDVRLVQNTTTPGNGDEPGYALTVGADGRITQ